MAGLAPAATAVGLGAGCGGDEEGGDEPGSRRAGKREVRLLNSALALEHTTIAAYTAGLPLLSGRSLRSARRFLEHEREHADALARSIRDLGGRPVEPKSADEYARGFPRLRTQEDVLIFAVDLENRAVRTYVDSVPKLSDPALRQAAGAIATNEAEHASVLLGALGRPQVPSAFVTGKQ